MDEITDETDYLSLGRVLSPANIERNIVVEIWVDTLYLFITVLILAYSPVFVAYLSAEQLFIVIVVLQFCFNVEL